MRVIAKIFERLFVTLTALLFLQIPQFIQQYVFFLQGHLSELNFQVNLIQNAAMQTHKSLHEYINKFLSSIDPDFAAQGRLLNALVERREGMSDSLNILQDAALWKKPFLFLAHFDFSLAKETLVNFKPGIYLNLESAVYLSVGLLFGYLFIQILRRIYEFSRDKKKRLRHI